MNSPEQSDKVAVITGGASGIGAAIARGLGAQRMRVVIADIDTPLTKVLHTEQFRSEYTRAIPMNRYGTPEDVAAVVGFLASDGAAYMTGAAIPVDGGFMAAGARPD